MLTSQNPATAEVLARVAQHDDAEIDRRLSAAARAQRDWSRQPVAQRTQLLLSLAVTLRQRVEDWARLISLEMGKPIAEARAEIQKCATTCEFYAQHAPAFLADLPVSSAANDSRVVYDPLGVLLAVMPWNYPFWQAIRAIAPAIASGNAVVLKHASNVPQCAQTLDVLFSEAQAPAGLYATLLVGAHKVPDLIADARTSAVTFTGSTPAGRAIAASAGQALKKQVLELGGSDPFIVLADADVDTAAQVAARARFQNTGQSCIAAKRFIVEERIADRFVEAVVGHARALVMGDPLRDDVQMGSMARESLRAELNEQVQRTLAQGARLCVGGRMPDGPGAFYEATVLDHVTPEMAAGREETFGPAAAVIRVRDAEQAIAVANGTEFGLGAALWTTDLDRAALLARRIEAGAVFVNGMVASDPRLPFGGVKQSGYGRELGHHGMHEFTNIKTVWTGPART